MNNILIVILFFLPFIASGQKITLFAGTGSSTFGGDGGPATDAQISDPIGGIFDKYGNYYFVGLVNENRIRKIDTNGIITTVAGGGTGGDGISATLTKLNLPTDVKLDTLGNIIITDGGNNRIRRVNIATGIISTIAGTGTAGFGGDGGPASTALFSNPQGICFDRKGNLYICDPDNYRVRKINKLGIITTFAGTGTLGASGDGIPATSALLDIPESIVADDTGNIYFADNGGLANKVRKVDTFGIITTVAGNGTGTYSGDEIPAINAQIAPLKVAMDSFNNLFIADYYNQRVYKVDTAGIIHNIAGDGVAGFDGDGGPATSAELYSPSGVALDRCGNLFITEAGTVTLPDSGNNIRKVTFDSTCGPYHAGSLGITEISSSIISIYPNPASSTITITSPNKLSQITISNLIGQTKNSQAYEAEKVEINIANLPPGIYMVAIIDEEGNKTVKKIVKE